jgi:hypothetical protein
MKNEDFLLTARGFSAQQWTGAIPISASIDLKLPW